MSHQVFDNLPASGATGSFWEDSTGADPNGTNDKTKAIRRTGSVSALNFIAQEGLPVAGGGATQAGFYFSGTEKDGGMHSFPGTNGAIGWATNAATRAILRDQGGAGKWSLNAGTIAQANAIAAHHYVGMPAGTHVGYHVEMSNGPTDNAVGLAFTNSDKADPNGAVMTIVAYDTPYSPAGVSGVGGCLQLKRSGSSTSNSLGFSYSARDAAGNYGTRFAVTADGATFANVRGGYTGTYFGVLVGGVYQFTVENTGGGLFIGGPAPYTNVSDRKFKGNIQTIALDIARNAIASIPAREWDWNDAGRTQGMGGHSVGFVAQEVRELIPDAVFETSDGTLALAESKMIPYLWTVVQDLMREVDRLKGVIGQPAKPAATPSAPLSINLQKSNNLINMTEPQLLGIGFTADQTRTFLAGSGAIKAGLAAGMTEAEVLRLLGVLLSSMGLTLSGVLSRSLNN